MAPGVLLNTILEPYFPAELYVGGPDEVVGAILETESTFEFSKVHARVGWGAPDVKDIFYL